MNKTYIAIAITYIISLLDNTHKNKWHIWVLSSAFGFILLNQKFGLIPLIISFELKKSYTFLNVVRNYFHIQNKRLLITSLNEKINQNKNLQVCGILFSAFCCWARCVYLCVSMLAGILPCICVCDSCIVCVCM